MSISSGYTFGELLKQFRVREGMSQKDLADALHFHRNTISNWECGNDLPKTRPVVLTLSETLHLNQHDTNELLRTSLLDFSSKEPLESYHVLSKYLQRCKTQLLDTPVPGSTNLHMREIIEGEGLFIPPPWQMLGGSLQTTTLLEYLFDNIAKNQRVMLLGEAGQGKTTIFKQIFNLLVDRFLEQSHGLMPLPLFVPLRELSSFAGSAVESLWSYVGEKFPLSFSEFALLVRKNQVIILFDGFDEINSELSQRSINEHATSQLFTLPSMLSCRKNFYEFYLSMSSLQERYPRKVELRPLQLNRSVEHYIAAFCQKRSEMAPQEAIVSSDRILQTIQENQALRDLAHRPLLLMMMLDIFTSPQAIDEIGNSWGMAKLYQKYTEKWLKNEAAKSDSVLRWYEKAAIVQELAWWLYTARGAASSAIQTYEGVTFTQRELTAILESLANRMKYIPLHQLIDDICLRTFLIGCDGGTYYFIHKSFQEYYAARYIFEHLKHREQNIESVACVLREHFSLEVAVFLKHMLRAKEFSRGDRELVVKNLVDAYQQNCRDDPKSVMIRNNASYYAAFLGGQYATQFLDQAYKQESNKWVQRSMMVGLALFCDRDDILEQYIDMLLTDSEAASINIGYHLVYYGDQPLEEGYYDRGSQKCDGAVRSIFDRLRDGNYRKARVLDLFTLRTLLEQRGISVLWKNEQNISFLKEFLDKKHEEQGSIFHQEKKRLQELLRKE
ncbi:MAG: NACHT domain-containing protein [Ktedonobacteraceae bacterium]